jgi:hypothetical protein
MEDTMSKTSLKTNRRPKTRRDLAVRGEQLLRIDTNLATWERELLGTAFAAFSQPQARAEEISVEGSHVATD